MQFDTPACAAALAISGSANPPPTSLINTAVLVVQSRPSSITERSSAATSKTGQDSRNLSDRPAEVVTIRDNEPPDRLEIEQTTGHLCTRGRASVSGQRRRRRHNAPDSPHNRT